MCRVLVGEGVCICEVALYGCFLVLGFREPRGREKEGERERERQRETGRERERERERVEAVHVTGSLNINCRHSS